MEKRRTISLIGRDTKTRFGSNIGYQGVGWYGSLLFKCVLLALGLLVWFCGLIMFFFFAALGFSIMDAC